MFCAKCGTENDDAAVFCRSCGSQSGGAVQQQPQVAAGAASASYEELTGEAVAASRDFIAAIPTPAEDAKYYLMLGGAAIVGFAMIGRAPVVAAVLFFSVAYAAVLAYKSANTAWVVLAGGFAASVLAIPFALTFASNPNNNMAFIGSLLLVLGAFVAIIVGSVLAFRFAKKK